MRRKRNRPANPLLLRVPLPHPMGEGSGVRVWGEGQGDESKHSRLWTLDLGLWTQQNCTISAPFLHRFLYVREDHSLIIKDLQNFLHCDIVSQSFSFQALRFTAPFLHHSCTVSSP